MRISKVEGPEIVESRDKRAGALRAIRHQNRPLTRGNVVTTS